MSDEPITKRDLEDLKRDLETFILERELKTLRWTVGIQIAYFSITFASVYFLITHWKP
jgi:hypothetical protein